MAEPYKATLLLELRDRIAAVEQRIQKLERTPEQSSAVTTPDHFCDAPEIVATDADLRRLWHNTADDLGFGQAIRAIYNLGCEHGAANLSAVFTNSNYPAKPDSSSAPTVTRKPLVCPSAATIAECGGPCEYGSFWYCDCGLLEKLNPDLKPQSQPPAGGLVEQVRYVLGHYGDVKARAAILAVAGWLESQIQASDYKPMPVQKGAGLAVARWLRKEVERNG